MLKLSLQGLKPYKGKVFLIIILSTLSAICEVGFALCTGHLANSALLLSSHQVVTILLIIVIVISIQIVVDMMVSLLSRRQLGFIQHDLNNRFIQAVLWADYKVINVADLLTSFTNDVPNGARFLVPESISLASNTILFVIVLTTMALIKPFYTLFFMVFAVGMILVQIRASKPIGEYTFKSIQCLATYNEQVLETFQNSELISAHGIEDAILDRCDRSLNAYLEACRKRLKCFIRVILTSKNAMYIPLILTYVACGYDVCLGKLTPGFFLAYTSLASHANAWIRSLSSTLSSMRESSKHIEQFENNIISLTENSISAAEFLGKQEKSKSDDIIFERVSFGFDCDTLLIDDVSFCIHKGEKVAILGEIGSGKSTILKLMLGLYQPKSGVISVFGQKTNDTMNCKIAYVAQEDFFLPGSIKENIVFGGKCPTDDFPRFQNAVWSANIDQFVSSLPQKYNTLVEDNGDNLSGGQRQRIALGRAVYYDAQLILLDEATSALEPSGEKLVLERVLKSEHEKTMIFVTHSSYIASLCDRVFLVKNKKIVEVNHCEQHQLNVT